MSITTNGSMSPNEEKPLHPIHFTNKHVILSHDHYKGPVRERVFFCKAGSGCAPYLLGRSIFGIFLYDGEHVRIERSEILRLATSEEIVEAKAERKP